MWKCVFDIVLYQMLVSSLKPDLVIEIGTHKGGSALYIADLLNNIGNGIVHTIDITDSELSVEITTHPRIRTFSEGWQAYRIDETEAYRKILVIDDGSHLYEDVLGAFERFHPVVSQGSYYIIEDGVLNYLGYKTRFRGGPLRAIREIVARFPAFSVDASLEHFFGRNCTFNPMGYLKRTAG
jgi:cephalosporin hydroxylase